jgi:hypothetical protein
MKKHAEIDKLYLLPHLALSLDIFQKYSWGIQELMKVFEEMEVHDAVKLPIALQSFTRSLFLISSLSFYK